MIFSLSFFHINHQDLTESFFSVKIMFSVRLVLMVIATGMLLFNFVFGGQSNDIVDEIHKLQNRMGSMEGEVKRISEREEKTGQKVDSAMNQIDEKLSMLVGKMAELSTDIRTQNGEMKKDIGELKHQNAEIKNQGIETKKEIEQVVKQNVEMKNTMDMVFRLSSGWKFYGRGISDRYESEIDQSPLTFTQCEQLCQQQRLTQGEDWNGMMWHSHSGLCYCLKNDKGHRTSEEWMLEFMHFKRE